MSRRFWVQLCMLGVAAMPSWPLSADADARRLFVRDRAIGTSAKPATTAQLPAAGATAMGAAPFARSYSRTSITHSPLLCRQQCLPVIGPLSKRDSLARRRNALSLI